MALKPVVLAVLLLLPLTLTGCASSHQPGGVDNLPDLYKLSGKVADKNTAISSIRMQAIQDTAMSLAAQAALASQSIQINATLTANEKRLTQAFDFGRLLLPHNVLPPVLTEGRNDLNLASNDTIRLADRTYQIASQARFVTAAPSWREYLWMNYSAPAVPSLTLLPKNSAERAIWDQYINIGWSEGLVQADAIYSQNLARLKRDYNGIVMYRKLLSEHMVSPPYVVNTDLGITGGGSDMRIHDQVLRITAMPTLQADSKTWTPGISR